MSYNEADTRAYLIDPKLEAAGWGREHVRREHFYRPDVQYTPGRIVLHGEKARHREGRKVDYLLRYTDAFPIAVVEAKEEELEAEAGLEQAKAYARDLTIPFAYTTNGHRIVEFDFFTNTSRDLSEFPGPDELWGRWLTNTGLGDLSNPQRVAQARALYSLDDASARRQNPLLHPYCPTSITGKGLRYFQEAAIGQVLQRIMRGQNRILLTMATGTGKTFTAMQLAWKLVKSGWLQRQHPERPGRILFIADRVVLRDQAYNAFSAFATEGSDPRHLIEGHPALLTRDLYFGIYQSLWAENDKGQRLFEAFPPDFFDLIIVDEAHRSGFGTWQDILKHFGSAIHLGMTATPKRSDNVDTYEYFCKDEAEILVDPDDPSKGSRQVAAYEYSLGQGIEDGFLATYKAHRVHTTVDKSGLRLREAVEQGAEVFIPEGVAEKEIYITPQFEREITLPDRTKAMSGHLAGLLRRFGPSEKTMIFCVDISHAQLVAKQLNDAFVDLGMAPYAVPIVSEEGQAPVWLQQFQDSDHPTPVVATTAELLSTGVDVPACRNIVFMKTVSSPVLFKQIIGRGARVDPATDKLWFRIVDYTGATRLFDEWDLPPGPPPELPEGPQIATLEGEVVKAETGEKLVGATVTLLVGPNLQRGPIRTGKDGEFRFEALPEDLLTLIASGTGFRRKQLQVQTIADETVSIQVELKPEGEAPGRIRVEGLEVRIAEEAVFVIEGSGEHLTQAQYLDYTRAKVQQVSQASAVDGLRSIWVNTDTRRRFLQDLQQESVYVDVLAEVLGQSDADQFDLLCHLVFASPLHTRSERAAAFVNRESRFLKAHKPDAQEVILALLEKYRAVGIDEISDPRVFRLSPFREMGQAPGVAKRFGSLPGLQKSLTELQERIYN
ncbi:MAG: DEAD/DEAH box helicase family protein [Anaerolineales bacterium]|nr:DEAD/DEAH box helicase family protein [Anaerolineales bacterium]